MDDTPSVMQPRTGRDKASKHSRNRAETMERILQSAIDEFCEHGFAGANTTLIVQNAGCNIRMLYHYFESKEGLYRAALERTYAELRQSEEQLSFWNRGPREGIAELTRFTFDYMRNNPRFPKMIINENLNKGQAVRDIASVNARSGPFIDKIDLLLEQGRRDGVFAKRPSAVQLYITILALSFVHVSNFYTLSAMFGTDLSSEDFLLERRAHVVDVVLGYLEADKGTTNAGLQLRP